MPNARHASVIDSPSKSLATKRRRSSITEHSFQGINPPPALRAGGSVTYVSGTFCYLCVGSRTRLKPGFSTPAFSFLLLHLSMALKFKALCKLLRLHRGIQLALHVGRTLAGMRWRSCEK